jgi:hypothetical protein
MGIFGLLNYEDYLIRAVVNSEFAHKGLTVGLTYLITAIVKLHISAIICSVIYWNNMADLIFPIIIGILLSLSSDTIFKYVETHKTSYEPLVDYFMKNYSRENLIKWKRIGLLITCVYIFILLALVDVDNNLIAITTIQTSIVSVSCDMIEQKMHRSLYSKLYDWWYQPRVRKIESFRPVIMEYYNTDPMLQVPIETEVPPKPPTPKVIRLSDISQIPPFSGKKKQVEPSDGDVEKRYLISSDTISIGSISPPISPKPPTPPPCKKNQ